MFFWNGVNTVTRGIRVFHPRARESWQRGATSRTVGFHTMEKPSYKGVTTKRPPSKSRSSLVNSFIGATLRVAATGCLTVKVRLDALLHA